MNQTRQILSYMQRGRSIDQMLALRLFRSSRLAARIKELREWGHQVNREMIRTRDGKRFARYTLEEVSATLR